MKKISLTGIRKLELIESPKPRVLKRDDVLLQIDTVGVCGSDMHYYKHGKIGDQVVKYPVVMGHEGSGYIEKIDGNVNGLQIGQLVAIEPAVSCGECDCIRNGSIAIDRRLRQEGFQYLN